MKVSLLHRNLNRSRRLWAYLCSYSAIAHTCLALADNVLDILALLAIRREHTHCVLAAGEHINAAESLASHSPACGAVGAMYASSVGFMVLPAVANMCCQWLARDSATASNMLPFCTVARQWVSAQDFVKQAAVLLVLLPPALLLDLFWLLLALGCGHMNAIYVFNTAVTADDEAGAVTHMMAWVSTFLEDVPQFVIQCCFLFLPRESSSSISYVTIASVSLAGGTMLWTLIDKCRQRWQLKSASKNLRELYPIVPRENETWWLDVIGALPSQSFSAAVSPTSSSGASVAKSFSQQLAKKLAVPTPPPSTSSVMNAAKHAIAVAVPLQHANGELWPAEYDA
jgi:hypothetical protein